jgi:hypothetical protein
LNLAAGVATLVVSCDRLLLLIAPRRPLYADECGRIVVALDSRNRLSVVQ